MSTVVSALVVLCALIASGVILVQLFMSESRRGRGRVEPPKPRVEPVRPAPRPAPVYTVSPASGVAPPLPERLVPPPPAPRVRRERARPATLQPVRDAWTGTLSPDGAWLWTGSAWVPSWWAGPTVPPPLPYAAPVPPPPATRSHGCLAAFGMGCAVVIGVVAVIVLVAVAMSGGLTSLPGG
jgi:hypothetical protein